MARTKSKRDMTKVTKFFNDIEPNDELKKIEFVWCISRDIGTLSLGEAEYEPSSYDYVHLTARSVNGFDVFIAWDKGCRETACLYLGHFNDGVV